MKRKMKVRDSAKGIKIHRALNWAMTVTLFIFGAWSVYLNIQARSLIKEAMNVAGEVENKIGIVSENISTVTELCNNVSNSIDQIYSAASTTKK
jgi:hypothetical protein